MKDGNSFPGSAPPDGCLLARRQLFVGRSDYLYDNPLLKEPLKLSHVKPLVVGHWGTTPGSELHLRAS